MHTPVGGGEDELGYRYLSLPLMAQLPAGHRCWEALRRIPTGWRQRMPIDDAADCTQLYEEGWRVAFQFDPQFEQLVGYLAVEYQAYECESVIVQIVWERKLFARRTFASVGTHQQQQYFLRQYLLEELWHHECIYNDCEALLPAERFQEIYAPPLEALLGEHEPNIAPYLWWFERSSKKLIKYQYLSAQQRFVRKEEL